MTKSINLLLSRWAKVGAMYNVMPSRKSPDLELLLIDTARHIPGFSRLLPMTVTWLTSYFRLICRHRLAHMTRSLQDPSSHAILGLLLDTVRQSGSIDHFNAVIQDCRALEVPRPLFDTDCVSKHFIDMAHQRSCAIGKTWGLWHQDIQLKTDAIRPPDWIMNKNPSYQIRAIFKGNLRSSILVLLKHNPDTGASESALSRACGATRKAVREALDHLEFCRMVQRQVIGNHCRIVRI